MCERNYLEENIKQDTYNNYNPPSKEELQQIYEKIEQLEEKIQKNDFKKDLYEQTGTYIEKMSKDLNHNLWIKYSTLVCLAVYSVVLHVSIFSQYKILSEIKELPIYAQFAFVSTTIFSTFLAFSKIIEGTFRTHNERHKHDTLPPNIQQIIQTLKPKD
ncbi:hypothetical protein HUT03_02170 [Candidatus Liberibacter africanus]|uniref:Transmembrane protein n=1 Tax=Candidatus Liberibacter africanus PTSAPSY TaxID=1277257 RepID=A0A0G3I8K4_LIBAF|nr:hypothetical protein [Candidatus Liberibacter africanus]AKK20072.1 hypothetical protein G293_02200 [Candidatus Liberibacter africanus PTSAPSY]QTP63891.1 hypothetical protein HUT03_02170 [Candidatus Liberibacter africanus]